MNLKMKEAYDIIYKKNKAGIDFYRNLILPLEKEERKAIEAKLRGEKSNYNAVKKLLNKNKINYLYKKMSIYEKSQSMIQRLHSLNGKTVKIPSQIKESLNIICSVCDPKYVYKIKQILISKENLKIKETINELKHTYKGILKTSEYKEDEILYSNFTYYCETMFAQGLNAAVNINQYSFKYMSSNGANYNKDNVILISEPEELVKLEQLLSSNYIDDEFIIKNIDKIRSAYKTISVLNIANLEIDKILNIDNLEFGLSEFDFNELKKVLKQVKLKNEIEIKKHRLFLNNINQKDINKKFENLKEETIKKDKLKRLSLEKERLHELRQKAIMLLKEEGKISQDTYDVVIKGENQTTNVKDLNTQLEVIEAEKLIKDQISTLEVMDNISDESYKTK